MVNPDVEGHVLGKLVDVVAVMVKRGWEDDPPEQRHSFFAGLEAALRGQHGLSGQAACLSMLCSIVVEFAGCPPTPLGMPADFHVRCKTSFEASGLLLHFFVVGRDAAGQVAAVLAGAGDSSVVASSARVCLEGVKLASQILSWDFDLATEAKASGAGVGGEHKEGGRLNHALQPRLPAAADHQVSLIRPGPSWRDLLAGPARIRWVVELYAVMRARLQQGHATPLLLALAAALRHLLVQLASLTGALFPSEAPGPELVGLADSSCQLRAHVDLLMRASAAWLAPVTAAVQRARTSEDGERELVDVLSMWQAAAATCPAAWAGAASEGGGATPDYFALLAEAMQEVLAAGGGGGAASCGDNSWAEEGFGVIGGTLLALLAASRAGVWQPCPPAGSLPLSPGHRPDDRLLRAVQATFHTFVSSQMGAAAAGALAEDEGEQERCGAAVEARDESLALAAALARATPLPSLRFLLALVDQRRGMLMLHGRQAAQARGADASGADGEKHVQCLEELHWLLLIVGHVLADAGGGELPCVPEEFFGSAVGGNRTGRSLLMLPGGSAQGAHRDPPPSPLQGARSMEESSELAEQLLNLSHAALGVAILCLDADARTHALSPRVMEAAVWLAGRWADTYLMLGAGDEGGADGASMYPPLLLSRLGGDEGQRLLHSLASVVLASLTAWPGETDLHMVACSGLLRALVRRAPVCARLLRLDLWQQLCRAVCAGEGSLASLAARVQRVLMQCLVQAAAGLPPDDAPSRLANGHATPTPTGLPSRRAYVTSLLVPVTSSLVHLAALPDLVQSTHRADRIHRAGYALEALRGGVAVPLPGVPAAAFAACVKEDVLGALLALATAYRHAATVTGALLKASEKMVEACLSTLQAQRDEASAGHGDGDAMGSYRHGRALLLHFAAQVVGGYARHAAADATSGVLVGGPQATSSGNHRGSAALGVESRSERARHLCALLRLLSHLVALINEEGWATVLEDAQAPAAGLSGDLPRVVSDGVQAVAPLITPDALLYPKVCALYFRLVGTLMQAFASQMDRLPGPTLTTLVRSLEYGIRHTDINVARPSLEALATLASGQAAATMPSTGQLAMQVPASATAGSSVDAEVLRHFLHVLLHFLFLEDYAHGLLEPACGALLPLLLWDQGVAFPGFVRAMCAEHMLATAVSPKQYAHVGVAATGDPSAVQARICASIESLLAVAASVKDEYLGQRQTIMGKFRGRWAAIGKFRACLLRVISENWGLLRRSH